MLKLLGCMLVLGGSVGYQLLHAGRSRTELEILAEMKMVLDRMEREVRINRISLPRLLNRLATMCRTEAAGLLMLAAEAVERGESLSAAWQQGCDLLPIGTNEKRILTELADKLSGDEEALCKGIIQVKEQLSAAYEEQRAQRLEKERRSAALSVSAAAFLMILLL